MITIKPCEKHDERVKKASEKGFKIGDQSCGSTAMALSKNGSTAMIHIDQETGEYLGRFSLQSAMDALK